MRSPLGSLAKLANRTPIPYVTRGTGAGQPWYRPGGTESQMRAMGSVGTLFSIVDRNASSTSSVRWKLCRTARPGEREEDREEVTRHLALDIWNKPNKFFTRQLFVETFQQHYELVGEGWWVVARNPSMRSIPLEMWPVMPHRIQPVPDPDDYLIGYMYMSPDGQQIPLRLDEVIQIRRPNPVDPYRGIGPVQTILADLEGVRLSAEWNRNFFLNSAEPGGIVEVDRRLSDDEYNEMVDRWREQHQGTANAHRVAMLEGGAKWVERTYTRRDMQFTEMRSVSSAVIREAFGMPKFAVGDVEDVNRATAEASKAWYAEQITVPRLERIKQALNEQFLPMFGATGKGVEFDYESPVPADREADRQDLTSQATAAKTLIDAGLPRPYALSTAGLPELPEDLDVPEEDPEEPEEPAASEGEEPGGEETASARALAEVVQKVYLGVNTVVTWEEARAILVKAGADIDPDAPKPEPSAPAVPPGQEEEEEPAPAEEAPPEPPTNELTGLAPTRALRAQDEDLDPDDLPDVGPLAEQLEAALADLLAQWGPISDAQKAELVQQVRDAAADGDLSDLNDLEPPTDEAEEALTAAMAAIAGGAAALAVREAADQGVEIDPAEPERDQLADVAKMIARGMATDLAQSAGREALRIGAGGTGDRSAEEIADGVREHLGSLTDAQPRQRLGQALHTAQHQARAATFKAAERKNEGKKAAPVFAYYASERNDRNTCGPCREIDGRFLGNTWADAERDYPTGGYERCEGRDRCRGQVVVVYRPKQVKQD